MGDGNFSDTIAPVFDNASTFIDGMAEGALMLCTAIDVAAMQIGATAGVVLSPGTSPITGPAGVAAGYVMAEAGTQSIQVAASALGLASTSATIMSDILTGDSSLDIGFEMKYSNYGSITYKGSIGQDSYVSSVITLAGYKFGKNAPSALAFQTMAVANDIGLLRNPEIGIGFSRFGKKVQSIGFDEPGGFINLLGQAQSSGASYLSNKLPKRINFSGKYDFK